MIFPVEVYCTEVNCVVCEGAKLVELYNSVMDSTRVHGCFTSYCTEVNCVAREGAKLVEL